MLMKKSLLVAGLFLAMLCAGCSGNNSNTPATGNDAAGISADTVTPEINATATPITTPEPTATATPAPTATPEPTATPAPTATPEPTPTLALIAENEWDVSDVDISDISPDDKLVAFTFDDGPTENYEVLLDTLKEYGMHATFFVWGNRYSDKYHDVMLRVINEGNEFGNHTWSHPYLTKISTDEVLEEIEKTRSLLEEITGKREFLVRPPYGSANADVKANVYFPMINWSLDSNDWNNGTYESVYEKLTEKVQDGDIILMHASYKFTADAVRDAIPVLIEKGYRIVSVSQLCAARGKVLKANAAPLGMKITG